MTALRLLLLLLLLLKMNRGQGGAGVRGCVAVWVVLKDVFLSTTSHLYQALDLSHTITHTHTHTRHHFDSLNLLLFLFPSLYHFVSFSVPPSSLPPISQHHSFFLFFVLGVSSRPALCDPIAERPKVNWE